jgi:hypothetical protein
LIAQRDTYAALDLLGHSAPLLDPEATLTLRLDALAAGGRQRLLLQEIDRLLAPALTPASLPLVKVLCAHVIRFPNQEVYDRLAQKIARDPIPMRTDTAGLWFSLFCAAGVAGDHARLHELTHQLRNASAKPFLALSSIEAFFRGETAERTITTFLPVLPLPLEVTYALLDRFVPAAAAPDGPPPRP